MKQLLYWIIFIAAVLQLLGFFFGDPGLPESYDFMR